MDRALLLFEDKFPCWDEETFVLAGENFLYLKELESAGYLTRAGGGYVLTAEGEKKRKKAAEHSCLPITPIGRFSPQDALWRNRLYLLMENAFIGQFGIKEYTLDETFPIAPNLKREELWSYDKNKLRYIWNEQPAVQSFVDRFSDWGVKTRGKAAPGRAAIDEWLKDTGTSEGSLNFELVLRSRYDFELYRKSPEEATDIFKLKDADRLFFHRFRSMEDTLDVIGRLHLFLLANKRVYIPGYADFDSYQQGNWTMLVIVADTEKKLDQIGCELEKFGNALTSPARPLFIVGTSIERLRMQHRPEYTVYDWFSDRTMHIVTPDDEWL